MMENTCTDCNQLIRHCSCDPFGGSREVFAPKKGPGMRPFREVFLRQDVPLNEEKNPASLEGFESLLHPSRK